MLEVFAVDALVSLVAEVVWYFAGGGWGRYLDPGRGIPSWKASPKATLSMIFFPASLGLEDIMQTKKAEHLF